MLPLRFTLAAPIGPLLLRCCATHAFNQCSHTIRAPAARLIWPQIPETEPAVTPGVCTEQQAGLVLLELQHAVGTAFFSGQAPAAGEGCWQAGPARL